MYRRIKDKSQLNQTNKKYNEYMNEREREREIITIQ